MRLYEPALITELATQYYRSKNSFRNKNEFLTHIIESGLNANRKTLTDSKKKVVTAQAEESDMYQLLLEMFKYTSNQFRKIYIDHNVLQGLLCTMYNILLAIHGNERLFESKIKDGFYDDLPERFIDLIEELKNRYGLN